MRKSIFAISATGCFVLTAALSSAQSVVINEYVNTGTTADKIELLVIQNNLDMRGMLIKDYSSNMVNDGGGAFILSNNALWSSVPAGTLVYLENLGAAASTDTDSTDHHLHIGLTDATYSSSTGVGSFDIATTDMIQIKASGSAQAGSTGVIHTLGAGTAGAQYTAAPTPKLLASGTTGANIGVAANNSTSTLADYNGTDATGALAAGSQTLGSANNANNLTYINALIASAVPDWSMIDE